MKYELNHIYCADCYEAIKEIPNKSIDLIYTDIPYDFEGNGGGGCFGEKKREYHKQYEAVALSNKTTELDKRKRKSGAELESIAFGIDYAILEEFVRVCKKIYCYIWCSKKQILPLMKYLLKSEIAYLSYSHGIKQTQYPLAIIHICRIPNIACCFEKQERALRVR